MIDNHHCCAGLINQIPEFFYLAFANKGGRMGLIAGSREYPSDIGTG